jgi:hypothetical protein
MGLFDKMKGTMDQARDMQEQAMKQAGMASGMPGLGDPAAQGAMGDANAMNASGAEMRRLWAEGLDGTAVIKDFRDSGERLAGNTVLDLDMVVTVAGGEPYAVTHRMTIAGSDTSAYGPGSEYAVKVDPEDRQKLTFAPQA